MAVINKISGVEPNAYDYAVAYAKSQTDNSVVAEELAQAYSLISKSLGISVLQFLQLVKSKGTEQQQAYFLATYMNNVRPKNALFGVSYTNNTPSFISREIGA
jgi:hypothetical protein